MKIRFLAKMIIGCSDEVAEWMAELQDGNSVSKLGADCGDWSCLYRKHRKIRAALLENFFDFGKDGKITEEDRAAFEEVQRQCAGLNQDELVKKLESMTNVFFVSPIDDKTFDSLEVVFFLKVWYPCWLVYAEYPPKLIRKARQGDYKSLEKLLRLDVNVLHDKKISHIWAELSQNRRSIHFKNLHKAMNGLNSKQTARKNSKIRIAVFIREMSTALGQPLTYDEINQIFDEVSRERLNQPDSDIQGDPAAFKKAIQRVLKEAPYFPDRDKNKI